MRSLMRCFTILFLLLSVFSCKDDNSGKKSQVASVSNVKYTAAQGALFFEWDNPQTEDLAYVEISYTDNSGKLHRTLVLEGLNERWIEGIPDNSPYYFRFLVYDKAGNVSEPVEVMASALEATVNLFYGRVKLGVDFSGINVSWENNFDENFYIELTYTDLNGNNYKEEVVVAANSQGKQFVKIGASLTGSQSVDVYATIVDENGNESDKKMLKFYKMEAGKLDRSKWIVADKSSQGPKAENVLDGDINTTWENEWSSGLHVFPHYLTFDLGSKKRIEKAEFTHRQGKIEAKGLELWGNNRSAKAEDYEWTLFGSYDMDQNNKNPQTYTLPSPVIYRYVKLVFSTPGKDDSKNAALAEFVLYGQDISEE